MVLRVISPVMKTVTKVNLKELYARWLAAKERFEMSKEMETNVAHKNNFKKLYLALSKELHDELNAMGYKSKLELEKALANLKGTKPTLKLIKGGKDDKGAPPSSAN